MGLHFPLACRRQGSLDDTHNRHRPVDLNTLMMHLEETLAKAYQLKGDLEEAQRYRALADNRHATIEHF